MFYRGRTRAAPSGRLQKGQGADAHLNKYRENISKIAAISNVDAGAADRDSVNVARSCRGNPAVD